MILILMIFCCCIDQIYLPTELFEMQVNSYYDLVEKSPELRVAAVLFKAV